MDLSTHTSLAGLAEAIASAKAAASRTSCDLYVTGGLARDLWLEFGHSFDTGRGTEDIDFGFECENWKTFDALARELEAVQFGRDRRIQHRFRHPNGTEIDLIPFGGVERPDRTIAWPPEGNPVMNLVGFAEVAGSTVDFLLPGEVRVSVVTLPALAVLKILAWGDRRGGPAGDKDAHDLLVIGQFYLKARIPALSTEDEANLLLRNKFEENLASAELLGMDMAMFGSRAVREGVDRILGDEANPEGPLTLASIVSRYNPITGIGVIQALRTGFTEREASEGAT